MSFMKRILMRAFGRPQGVLGRLGGLIMTRMNRNMAARAIALLDVQPHDRVLEIGFGPGVGIELLARVVSSGRVVGVMPPRRWSSRPRCGTPRRFRGAGSSSGEAP
jgi:hypothetical protein